MEPDAKTDAIRALRELGNDLNRGAFQPNLAEQIWDQCDRLDALLTAQPAEGWQPTICRCGTTLVCPDIGCDENKRPDPPKEPRP